MATTRANGGELYPNDTPIVDMDLNATEIAMLTESARKLNKGQLIVLREVNKEFRSRGDKKVVSVFDQRTGLNLNLGDLTSIAHAFDDLNDRMNAAPGAVSCCCCSCCPCCSCCASVVIEAVLAE